MARYAFQICLDRGWTYDGVGQQDPSSTLATREAAETELPNLARALEVCEDDLRVVEVPDDFRAP